MTTRSEPDDVDTRIVFQVYAVLAGAAGLILFLWPLTARSDLARSGYASVVLTRITGALGMAAACCAAGFAQIEDPRVRHRALFWFLVAHVIVLVVLLTQTMAVGTPHPEEVGLPVLTTAVLILLYFFQTGDGYGSGPFREWSDLVAPGHVSVEQLRSRYEEQIREAAGQEERNRLARDLHDSIKQQVFVMQTAAATAQARYDDDPEGAKAALAQVRESARDAMTEMEAMLDSLRASPLENVGLVEALKKQCEALGLRTGARVTFEAGELPPAANWAPGAQQAVFRVAQEALANVGRHARPKAVRVALRTERDQLILAITDDGVGFDSQNVVGGMGLANMRARAAAFSGALSVRSTPGGGTVVRLSLPGTRTHAAAAAYWRRVAVGTAVAMAFVLFLVWQRSVMSAMLLLPFAAIVVVRTFVAYRRTRSSAEPS